MPQLDGRPDLALEQAPQQLQSLVASTNAFLASMSSVARDLQAATTPNQDAAALAGRLDTAIEQAQVAQQGLAEVGQAGLDDALTDQQAAALDRAAESITDAATDLSTGDLSAETRNALERQSAELGQMLQVATDRLAELQSSFPTGGTAPEIGVHRAMVDDVGIQIQSLEAARTVVDAAVSLVTQVTSQVEADSAQEVERRVAERMIREGGS